MRLGIAALTLTVGLGFVGLACADEPTTGGWWSNLFTRPAAKTASDKDLSAAGKEDPSKPPPSNRARQAKADLERRQAICLRLQQVAHEANDEELMRMADQLDQRAFDAYLAAVNRGTTPDGDADAKKARAAKGEQ